MSSKNPDKRSVTLGRIPNRRGTSVNLAQQDWDALEKIAVARGMKRNKLIEIIDDERRAKGLKNLSCILGKFVGDHAAWTGEQSLRQFADEQNAKTAAAA